MCIRDRDVRATNKKLVERAKKIVCEATGVDREVAEKVLKETNYDVKLSILMILTGLDINEAKEKLKMCIRDRCIINFSYNWCN